jgi:hypothetical protein
MAKRDFTTNQVFVGLPWRNVKPKYERCIEQLHRDFPLYFTIVGKDDGQDAVNLFEIIKKRIANSSWAIFDATGGNANVSLEYGYAEGIGVEKSLFTSSHKTTHKGSGQTIISDLQGTRRVQYTTEPKLLAALTRFCKEHAYTARFEHAIEKMFDGHGAVAKRKGRALAIAIIRCLDGRIEIRRSDVLTRVQALKHSADDVDEMLKLLHAWDLVKTGRGRIAKTYIAD